jgi:hypothetical protein
MIPPVVVDFSSSVVGIELGTLPSGQSVSVSVWANALNMMEVSDTIKSIFFIHDGTF